MLFNRDQFNSKRFLTLVLLFGGVAALMLFTKPKSNLESVARPFSLYDLHLTARNAQGSIILNGISIGHHKAGDSLQESTIALTPWLKNGKNTLFVTTSKPNGKISPDLLAELKVTLKDGGESREKLFHLTAASSDKTVFQVKGLPSWQWLEGLATFHDSQEIRLAVKQLHAAFVAKDLAAIGKVEAPLFHDMELLTGREGLERRVYRQEIIKKGTVEPLRPLIIVPFDNGRIMRVTNKDGEAPIRVYYKYGNGGKVILTGQFWSKINGTWHVVR